MSEQSSPAPHSAEYFGEVRDFWWNRDFLALMARRLDLDRVSTVLDVGCGVGHWGRALAAVLPVGATITGVDRESEWVAEAARRAGAAGLGARTRYLLGDALALPFADSTFDVVTCQTLLIHLPDALAGLREMLRVARPGGLVLAAEPSNLANCGVVSSLSDDLAPEDILDNVRLQLICQRGKRSLGLGFNSIGDLVPGLLASLGAVDLRVYLSDRAAPLYPPYAPPEQRAEVAQWKDWVAREFWAWDKPETRRYFIAGGGSEEEFERLWQSIGRQQAAGVRAIEAGTYHSAGGSIMYLVSGRRPTV